MDQETLRAAAALIVIVLMAWFVGYGIVLRLRGVNPNAFTERNTNFTQRALVFAGLVLALYLVLRAPFPRLDAWTGARLSPAPLLALSVMALGALLILASQSGMGRSWRVGVPGEGNHVDALVTGGLHRISRNPTYLGFMLFLAGAFLAAPGPLTAAGLVVSFAAFTIIIGEEERYLARRFGAQYEAYKKRVRRWI